MNVLQIVFPTTVLLLGVGYAIATYHDRHISILLHIGALVACLLFYAFVLPGLRGPADEANKQTVEEQVADLRRDVVNLQTSSSCMAIVVCALMGYVAGLTICVSNKGKKQ